jgi:hypothetical protein
MIKITALTPENIELITYSVSDSNFIPLKNDMIQVDGVNWIVDNRIFPIIFKEDEAKIILWVKR